MNDLEKAIKENIQRRRELINKLLENYDEQITALEESIRLTNRMLEIYKQRETDTSNTQ